MNCLAADRAASILALSRIEPDVSMTSTTPTGVSVCPSGTTRTSETMRSSSRREN
jgi:hypothetical protein